MDLIKKYWVAVVVAFWVCIFTKPILCFLILGTLLAYSGFAAVIFLKKISKTGIDSTGNITEYQTERNRYKTPIIEFTTMTGDVIKEKPVVYAPTDISKIRTYSNSVGQTVSVLYDPNDPKKFVLKNEERFNYIVSIFFILAGLLFAGLSILGVIKMG